MRCNQVSIFIERFGDYVPKDYPADVQRISVYVDDFKSIYAALSKAYALAINELSEYESIGVRADVSTNEFSRADYKEMHGSITKGKRNYEDDINWQYFDTRLELCSDYVWLYEHSDEILQIIKQSNSKNDMIISLKDKYSLSDYQIRKLSQIRLDMLTAKEYEEYKEEVKRLKEKKENVINTSNNGDSYKRYANLQSMKIRKKIEELEAYLKAAENYTEIIKLMEENDEFSNFVKAANERFGFTLAQCNYFKYMSINDFSKKEREKIKAEIENLKESLKMYEKDV